MTALFESYITSAHNYTTVDRLTQFTYDFLTKADPKINISLLKHTLSSKPLQLLKANILHEDNWNTRLEQCDFSNEDDAYYLSDELAFFVSNTLPNFKPVHIFAVEKSNLHSCQAILTHWRNLMMLICRANEESGAQNINDYGNLISQLLHDVHSLMEKQNSGVKNSALQQQTYQKALNKQLLFYIRPFDLYTSNVSLKKFLLNILQLDVFPVDLSKVQLQLENNEAAVNIDIDLFSRAITAVIINALDACENDTTKIMISTHHAGKLSPLNNQNFLRISISDKGCGIKPDFLPYILKPFFTTRKYEGKTGFGLTNAQKIVQSHSGFIEIETTPHTIVNIFLPEVNSGEKA